MIVLGDKEYYKGIGKINFEGKDSDNPFHGSGKYCL